MKMANKLYTEKQMRKVWNAAYTDALGMDEEDYKPKFFEDFIELLTPIELPSDEEILKKAKEEPDNLAITESHRIGYIAGAKWLKDKILNQNNDND
jgi:hypothetical protein